MRVAFAGVLVVIAFVAGYLCCVFCDSGGGGPAISKAADDLPIGKYPGLSEVPFLKNSERVSIVEHGEFAVIFSEAGLGDGGHSLHVVVRSDKKSSEVVSIVANHVAVQSYGRPRYWRGLVYEYEKGTGDESVVLVGRASDSYYVYSNCRPDSGQAVSLCFRGSDDGEGIVELGPVRAWPDLGAWREAAGLLPDPMGGDSGGEEGEGGSSDPAKRPRRRLKRPRRQLP